MSRLCGTIATVLELMKIQGCKVDRQETELSIDTRQLHSVRAPYEFVKPMRWSILLLGPLLARFGEADISLPGGYANIVQKLAGPGAMIRRV